MSHEERPAAASEGKPALLEPVSRRADRLLEIDMSGCGECEVEYSYGSPATWRPATLYPGLTTDQWRGCSPDEWNSSAVRGTINPGSARYLWNYFFDLGSAASGGATDARIRVRRTGDGKILLQQPVELALPEDVVVVDHGNAVRLCGGHLPAGWELKPLEAGTELTGVPLIHREVRRRPLPKVGSVVKYEIVDPDFSALVIRPHVSGRYRVYVGVEDYPAFRLWFSGRSGTYDVPNYHVDAHDTNPYVSSGECYRERQEFFIDSVDLTNQDISIAPGGSRFWRDVDIRYVRLVREDDLAREAPASPGRSFAGYMEPCTNAGYEPGVLTLREHIHNAVRQHARRGADEVYVHVIRIGSKAWYHSNVVERMDAASMGRSDEPGWGGFTNWMAQGDPLGVNIQEAREAGLKIFADAGMNATYYGGDAHYGVLTERFAREHPEHLCPDYPLCFDYRSAEVREYVVGIISELMDCYDLDGVNLDFARWGHLPAYDPDSLHEVGRMIHLHRQEAQERWGHPVVISVRVPYEAPSAAEVFVEALRRWAGEGIIDRFMVCLHGGENRVAPDTPMGHYAQAVHATETAFWLDMYQGTWITGGGPDQDVEIARNLIAQGMDGGVFYYMAELPIEWEGIGRRMKLI